MFIENKNAEIKKFHNAIGKSDENHVQSSSDINGLSQSFEAKKYKQSRLQKPKKKNQNYDVNVLENYIA